MILELEQMKGFVNKLQPTATYLEQYTHQAMFTW